MAKKTPTTPAKKKSTAKSSTPPPTKSALKKPSKSVAKKSVPKPTKAPVKPTAKAPAKKPAAGKVVTKKASPAPKTAPAAKANAKATKKISSSPSTTAVRAAAKTKSSVVKKSDNSTPSKDGAPAKKSAGKSDARAALRSRILGRTKGGKSRASIAFTLDEVQEIAKTTATKDDNVSEKKAAKARTSAAAIEEQLKAHKPTKIGAASLADILGFSPGGRQAPVDDPKNVAAKFRPYYRLLLDLRTHLTGQINQHSEDTLKRSAKEDAGDLSSYGQHMADAGTDTFDRDFALSMVANEQEALSEIEAAITRIKQGTYGICEATGEPIAKERLMAVPFTRFSAEAQKHIERNRLRVRTQAGLLADFGDDAGKIADSDDD